MHEAQTNKKNRFELKTTNKTKSSANIIKTVKSKHPPKPSTLHKHNAKNTIIHGNSKCIVYKGYISNR